MATKKNRISEAVRNALILLETAGQGGAFRCPEGVALLEHYKGLLNAAHALAKKGERRLRDLEELQSEILKAITQWVTYRELRPAGDPDFEGLLKFYRGD